MQFNWHAIRVSQARSLAMHARYIQNIVVHVRGQNNHSDADDNVRYRAEERTAPEHLLDCIVL